MSVAQQLGRLLYDMGIRRVYGLPGEDHMALLEGLDDAGLEYYTAFNETTAVLMAATDFTFTGLPGVTVLSMAPGVSNAMNGILHAYLEQVPVLVFSGQHAGARLPFVVRQGFEIERLLEPVTKWRARAVTGMDIGQLIGRAVEIAMSGRPGPVYVELPDAVAAGQAQADDERDRAVVQRVQGRWGQQWIPDVGATSTSVRHEVASLTKRLVAAKYPVLVVGGRRRRVSPATLEKFSAAFRAPVFTTTRQKGAVDPSAPFYAGTFLNGRLESALLSQSDLVLMIDPEPFDFYNRPWNFEGEPVALVAQDFTEWVQPFSECLTVDAEQALLALLDRAPVTASEWSPKDVSAYKASLRQALLGTGGNEMSVADAVAAALKPWPPDGYIIADAGFSKPLVALLSEPSAPDRFLASNALSTMGFAIPAAIAAQRAGKPVLGFLGDGSLLMRATELMAAVADGPPMVLVPIMDGSLTQIALKQERRGLRTVGSDLPTLSCSLLAQALGTAGTDVATAEEVSSAVSQAMMRAGPTLIGAWVNPVPSRDIFERLRD